MRFEKDWGRLGLKFEELSQVSSYVSERIRIDEVNLDNYVSTENMISERGGVTKATKLPSGKTISVFQKGDILISNIRPYFKKIWLADKSGGCSNDVLVVRANEKISNRFLYYVLSSDNFFDYAVGTSTGTKMPRGDKKAIMKYKVPIYSLVEQEKIAEVLRAFDKKIILNKQINHHLEQMAITIFESMFTNVSSGQTKIGKYIIPKRGKNLLSKDAISGRVPVVAGGLQPSTFHNIANTEHPVLTISASGANAGYVNLWHVPVWASDSSYIDSKMTDNVYFWYVMLKRRQQEIYDSQTGSAQPHIYPKHIEIMPTIELSKKEINLFTKRVTPLFKTVGNNLEEIKNLQNLRESLLPKLLSGEISVNQATK